MKTLIFGAWSIATGTYRALRIVEPEREIIGFIVTDREGNPKEIEGLPVYLMSQYLGSLSEDEKDTLQILIATPEDVQDEIESRLREEGVVHIERVTSLQTAVLMNRYYRTTGRFPLLSDLRERGIREADEDIEYEKTKPGVEIYVAKFHKDKALRKSLSQKPFFYTLQVGAALTEQRIAELTDDSGDNISDRNPDYCELTALYWIWKNRALIPDMDQGAYSQYFGLAHYRRHLILEKSDINNMAVNKVDVVLPYPMICEPDIEIHHRRYINPSDWEILLAAIRQLYPEEANAYPDILKGKYMYNYNLMLAERNVFLDYCEWLFKILFLTDQLIRESGIEPGKRYLAYMGEELMSLYFMNRKDNLHIRHTGFAFLT